MAESFFINTNVVMPVTVYPERVNETVPDLLLEVTNESDVTGDGFGIPPPANAVIEKLSIANPSSFPCTLISRQASYNVSPT